MSIFDPNEVRTFRFLDYDFNPKTGKVTLNYAFDEKYQFSEEFIFPGIPLPISEKKYEVLEICLKNLHLAAGISYYKAAVPKKIQIENYYISQETSRFFEKLYTNGLAEFSYKNNLDMQEYVKFPFVDEPFPSAYQMELSNKSAIPIGGGKDSIVCIEILKQTKTPLLLISVGKSDSINKTIDVAQLPHIVIERTLSPLLLELNEKGALNGHVPISAIVSFAMVVAAVLYDFDAIVMSNERSANIGNLWHEGMEINHQYSKSFEFEQDFSHFINSNVLVNLRYFSLLRPLSELAITKLFCYLCEPYHDVFTSCSASFTIKNRLLNNKQRWCLDCPKCRFIFLIMAPFMSKEKLLDIFSRNLFANPSQLEGFMNITGYGNHKPFSCIGEFEESIASFLLLCEKEEWQNDFIVKHFREKILPNLTNTEVYLENTFYFSENHFLKTDEKQLLLTYAEMAK